MSEALLRVKVDDTDAPKKLDDLARKFNESGKAADGMGQSVSGAGKESKKATEFFKFTDKELKESTKRYEEARKGAELYTGVLKSLGKEAEADAAKLKSMASAVKGSDAALSSNAKQLMANKSGLKSLGKQTANTTANINSAAGAAFGFTSALGSQSAALAGSAISLGKYGAAIGSVIGIMSAANTAIKVFGSRDPVEDAKGNLLVGLGSSLDNFATKYDRGDPNDSSLFGATSRSIRSLQHALGKVGLDFSEPGRLAEQEKAAREKGKLGELASNRRKKLFAGIGLSKEQFQQNIDDDFYNKQRDLFEQRVGNYDSSTTNRISNKLEQEKIRLNEKYAKIQLDNLETEDEIKEVSDGIEKAKERIKEIDESLSVLGRRKLELARQESEQARESLQIEKEREQSIERSAQLRTMEFEKQRQINIAEKQAALQKQQEADRAQQQKIDAIAAKLGGPAADVLGGIDDRAIKERVARNRIADIDTDENFNRLKQANIDRFVEAGRYQTGQTENTAARLANRTLDREKRLARRNVFRRGFTEQEGVEARGELAGELANEVGNTAQQQGKLNADTIAGLKQAVQLLANQQGDIAQQQATLDAIMEILGGVTQGGRTRRQRLGGK